VIYGLFPFATQPTTFRDLGDIRFVFTCKFRQTSKVASISLIIFVVGLKVTLLTSVKSKLSFVSPKNTLLRYLLSSFIYFELALFKTYAAFTPLNLHHTPPHPALAPPLALSITTTSNSDSTAQLQLVFTHFYSHFSAHKPSISPNPGHITQI
jgi:hypothetical protein